MRYFTGLLVACVIGVGAPATPARADTTQDCDQSADHELTIRACTELIRRNPRDGIAYHNRGYAYRMKGQDALALADYNEAISINPRDDYALSERGAAYRRKNDYARALADLNEAIRLNARDAFAFEERGETYREKGDPDRAIVDLNEATRIDSNRKFAYSFRGAAYIDKRDYDRAIADFTSALRIDPDDVYSLSKRAEAYNLKRDRAQAIDDYRRALAIVPKTQWDRDEQTRISGVLRSMGATPEPLAGAGNTSTASTADCQQRGDLDLSIRACSDLIRRNPRDSLAYTYRGDSYNMKGEYDRAISDEDEALRLNPRYAYAFGIRGSAFRGKNQADRAIIDLNEAISLDPRYAFGFGNRGDAYRIKGDYEHAIADLNEAIRINPTYADAYAYRGEVYRLKGDYERAIADLTQVLRLNPTYIYAVSRRAEAYREKGDRAAAIADYRRALATAPKTQWDRDEQARIRDSLQALESAPLPLPVPLPAPNPNPLIDASKTPETGGPPGVALGRRVALVIGNAGYRVGPLQNPVSDATAVADALQRQLGFDKVTLRVNLTYDGFRAALHDFQRDAVGAGLALVYYAGHATERNGTNFLIPVDAVLAKASDLPLETVPLNTVLEQIDGATKLKLVILDSCRNNMFSLAGLVRGGSRGLYRVEPGKNTLVVYAAKEGTVAADGIGQQHSPFTEALLRRIATPGLEVRFLFGEVRDDVLSATSSQQEPYVYGSLGGQRIFLGR